ncbi:hypothetical protein LTR97_009601 [Elasticomyces elasticus]|uniref:Casein kinase II beta 2 subunit n=1 Tax=Elasticomyces elasticus TaxID=574655 RepID=A0AAN7W1E0_9PEZI|nr:hypothetical protein LTR97_009601 [Elasticomyces elasticus]
MPPIPGLVHWHSLLTRHLSHIKAALQRAATTLDVSLQPTPTKLEPLLARINPKQPTHPLARIRQNQSRWYSSAARQLSESGTGSGGARHFSSSGAGKAGRVQRSSFPKSRVGGYVAQSSGRAPFAHTLRPNLTGGTLSRTSGGYTLGSAAGKRAFSHVPAAQAQVVQNVSQAIRAFVVGGQKAQFDGVGRRGEKRFKTVSALQEETGRKLRSLPKQTPGSWVEFRVNPSVTAIASLGSVAGAAFSTESCAVNLNTSGLLDVLSVDFSRALKDLAAVMNDLRSLSALGDLPITYEGQSLRVHFPGCDGETVERLCEELGITRGSVRQDEGFDAFTGTEIALLFPFAPSKEGSEYTAESLYEEVDMGKKYPIDVRSMFTPSEEHLAYSTQSAQSDEYEDLDAEVLENPWLSDPSGYESVRSGSGSHRSGGNSGYGSEKPGSPLEYQGFEGIYRFIEELDGVRK